MAYTHKRKMRGSISNKDITLKAAAVAAFISCDPVRNGLLTIMPDPWH
jgi:hypothetical protein